MAFTAMYYSKLEEKNTYKFFSIDVNLKIERDAIIETELRKAISNEEFQIKYQPKFNLINSELVGLEALIRWDNPRLGEVTPSEFIPIAEETGLICDIGNWVITETVTQLYKWYCQGYP